MRDVHNATVLVHRPGDRRARDPAGSTVTWSATPRHVETPRGWVVKAGAGTAVAGRCEPESGNLAATGATASRLGVQGLLGAGLVLAGMILLAVDRRRDQPAFDPAARTQQTLRKPPRK